MIKPLIFILGVLSFIYSDTPIPSNQSFLFCLKKEINPLIINRFETYMDKAFPILNFYKKQNLLCQINGMAKIGDISKEILNNNQQNIFKEKY